MEREDILQRLDELDEEIEFLNGYIQSASQEVLDLRDELEENIDQLSKAEIKFIADSVDDLVKDLNEAVIELHEAEDEYDYLHSMLD